MHNGRMLGASFHCVTWLVRPGLHVGEDGKVPEPCKEEEEREGEFVPQ